MCVQACVRACMRAGLDQLDEGDEGHSEEARRTWERQGGDWRVAIEFRKRANGVVDDE